MIPLVGEVKELKFVKDVVVKVADELIADAGIDMQYHVENQEPVNPKGR